MKREKQEQVLAIIETGRYTYQDGLICSTRGGVTKPLSPTVLSTGYKQHIIFNGKRGKDGIRAVVYAHQLVYMMHNGMYDETYEIDHINRDRSDNRIENLRAVSKGVNRSNRQARTVGEIKVIRHDEIQLIKELYKSGMSLAAIARELDLNRLSVRYTIKKIENGEEFKYECPWLVGEFIPV